MIPPERASDDIAGWAGLPERLAILRRARRLLADRARELADAAARPLAGPADVLVAEVLPLLAAIRWLESHATRVLRPVRPRGRPIWTLGTRLVVRRVPLGRVLVVGPGNYPLFLPGAQVVQALAAGNSVLVKPAEAATPPMAFLHGALLAAGLPSAAMTLLDEAPEAVAAALDRGVDHVVLTGGANAGRAILGLLAPRLLPATMELSGCDAMVVLAGADLDHAARAATYGLSLNGGRTCIAPRRIIVVGDPAPLRAALVALLPPGSRLVPDIDQNAPPFDGSATLVAAPDEAAAISLANAGRYALGASVFGPADAARRVGRRLRAGCVVINDMIAPTADPALPFGGTGWSGFGTTRGAEGLLAMTRPQAIVTRRGHPTRHLRRLPDSAAPLIASLLRLRHGTFRRGDLPAAVAALAAARYGRDAKEGRG